MTRASGTLCTRAIDCQYIHCRTITQLRFSLDLWFTDNCFLFNVLCHVLFVRNRRVIQSQFYMLLLHHSLLRTQMNGFVSEKRNDGKVIMF